jgi:hypothetical protein
VLVVLGWILRGRRSAADVSVVDLDDLLSRSLVATGLVVVDRIGLALTPSHEISTM